MKRLYSSILLSLTLSTSLNASNNSGRVDLFETSPMPGMITAIKVKTGDFVQKGDVLFKMEAMKMETVICAKASGKVGSLKFREGDNVNYGDVLVNYDDQSLDIAVLAAVGTGGNPPSGGGNSGDSGGAGRNSGRNSGSGGIDFSQPCYFNGSRWVQGYAPNFYYDGFEWLESHTTTVSTFETRVIEENVAAANEESMPSTLDTSTEIKLTQSRLADAIKWIESPRYVFAQVELPHQVLGAELQQAHNDAMITKERMQLQQTVDSIVIPLGVQFVDSATQIENLQLSKTHRSKHGEYMSVDDTNNSFAFKGTTDEFMENTQVPHKHNIPFIENERVEKSLFQALAKYVLGILFDPFVGFLASLMVMFYYMTSLLQSVAPLFVRRMPSLVRIRV